MYTTIRKYRTDPQSMDEIVRKIEDSFKATVSAEPGFSGYYVVAGGDGVLVTISVFEEQAGAERSTDRASTFIKEELPDGAIERLDVTTGSGWVSGQAGVAAG